VEFGRPKIRSVFVSFSVNRSSADPSTYRYRAPSVGCAAAMASAPFGPVASRSDGRGVSAGAVQVLRNQRVGRRCSVAGSGPRFATVMSASSSSGPSFAYSTKTSK